MQTTTNISAILRGEQRSPRFHYRHSVAAAAQELGIPVTWVWFWLSSMKLKSRTRLRKVWVRLEDVQKLFADTWAVRDAFYATGEFLTSPEAIRKVVERWPDEYHPCIKFPPPAKPAPQLAVAEVMAMPASNPVIRQEVAA